MCFLVHFSFLDCHLIAYLFFALFVIYGSYINISLLLTFQILEDIMHRSLVFCLFVFVHVVVCGPNQRKCDSGTACYNNWQKCDGNVECDDSSDEAYCGGKLIMVKSVTTFHWGRGCCVGVCQWLWVGRVVN